MPTKLNLPHLQFQTRSLAWLPRALGTLLLLCAASAGVWSFWLAAGPAAAGDAVDKAITAYGNEFERLSVELATLEGLLVQSRPLEREARAVVGLEDAAAGEPLSRNKTFTHAASMADRVLARDLVRTALVAEELLAAAVEVKRSYREVLDRMGSQNAWSFIPSLCPVDRGRMTSHYGWRSDPFTGRPKQHFGIDFSAPAGTPILAPASGVVAKSNYTRGYGFMVELDHGNGLTTRYAHLSRFAVQAGDWVNRDRVIGYVGSTGRASAPHLHYEVLVQGAPVDPRPHIFAASQLAD